MRRGEAAYTSEMTSFDPAAVRADFPILSREIDGKPLVYLDNGATSQKPRRVIEALGRFFSYENANIHRGVHSLSREATDAYDGARDYLKARLGVPASHELIFVRGTTEAVNLAAHGLSGSLGEGDEILLTVMEHHANFVPWQVLAERSGARLRCAGLRGDGSLDLEEWTSLLGPRTRIAAFAHVSNVLGTINPVAEMTALAKQQGAVTFVDGAQALPHGPVEIEALGADFYAFSGHKVYAPDGVGVLCGPRDLLDRMPPYQTGGDMIERVSLAGTTFRKSPERFEAGTPNISGAIGLAEAFRYLEGIDWAGARAHEKQLLAHASEELAKIEGIRIFGTTPDKAAILSYHYAAAHPHDVGTVLDTEGVAIRVGHHCAQPLMDYLEVPATARASFAFYNDHGDVEAFLRAMRKVERFFA
jgi:cysteine desulfurase/selenocysteine lyase